MPIIIKDFTWKQMHDKVCIQVPLHGIHPGKVDIFTSPQYIKAKFGSFFFDVLLLHPVDMTQSTCTKTENIILFNLKKCSENIWDSLEPMNISREEMNSLKRQFVQEEHERIKKCFDEKTSRKAELKRVAVNEQIRLDTKIRNEIEGIKKTEENKALGDLNEWKRNIETRPKTQSMLLEVKDDKLKNQIMVSHSGNASGSMTPKVNKEIRPKSKLKHTFEPVIPKPRNTRSLQVIFTPREFPTPSRESRLEEENEFLSKQAEARRSVGFIDEDLRAEEKNPQYLLAKGKEFLKNANYLGAISAFSFGVKLAPKFVDLYLARSEVHIIIGNFNRAVEDCTKALDLLKPRLPINVHDRAVCFGRRGLALYELGFLKQGLSELEASVKLEKSPEFETILEEYRLKFDDMQSKKSINANNRINKEENS